MSDKAPAAILRGQQAGNTHRIDALARRLDAIRSDELLPPQLSRLVLILNRALRELDPDGRVES